MVDVVDNVGTAPEIVGGFVTAIVALGLPPGPKARFSGESNLVSRSGSCTSCKGDKPDFRAVVDVGRGHVSGGRAAGFDPDVLVLTHDDKDHIGGVANFMKRLRPRTGRLQELWVPYEWGLLGRTLNSYRRGLSRELEPSSKVVMSPEDLIQVLDWTGEEVDRSPNEHGLDLPGVRPLEHYLGWAPESGIYAVTPLDEGEKERLTGDLIDELTVYQTTDPGFGIGSPKDVARRVVSSVDATSRAIEAAHGHGMRVRYFSIDHAKRTGSPGGRRPWQYAGRPGELTVVNAIEVVISAIHVRQPLLAFALIDKLSVQNKRALVTFVWPEFSIPNAGILIWSDSSGEAAQVGKSVDMVPWDHIAIMTAPHHGSGNIFHDPVWDELEAQRQRGRVIRVIVSGDIIGPNNQISQRFLNVDLALRACTMCRHGPVTPNIGNVWGVADQYGCYVGPTCRSTCV